MLLERILFGCAQNVYFKYWWLMVTDDVFRPFVVICEFQFWYKFTTSYFFRYNIWRGQPYLAHSLSSAQATRTSNFSASDAATVSNDYKLNILRNGNLEDKPLSVDWKECNLITSFPSNRLFNINYNSF